MNIEIQNQAIAQHKNGDYCLFYLRVYIYSGLLVSKEALKREVLDFLRAFKRNTEILHLFLFWAPFQLFWIQIHK